METKDPALTKNRIDGLNNTNQDSTDMHDNENNKGTQTFQETVVDGDFIHDMENLDNNAVDASMANERTNERIADENVTYEEPSQQLAVEEALANRQALANGNVQHNVESSRSSDIEGNTSVSNGTDTFKEDVVDSEHVNDNDNPARQPDRRDQTGSPFDENVNEETVGSEAPQSHEINDMNRYANVNNAQTRILNTDEKD